MARAPNHPGACHFYIHAVEAAHPQRAVPCAERLASLMPGAGHIVHMPAHIYIRVGRWADAIDINKHAAHADDQYFEGPHTPDAGFYSAAYQSHNHHFLTLAAVMAGASRTALEASQRVTAIVTPEIARIAPPVEPLLAVPVQTLVTFGRWEEVLRTPLPPSDLRVAMAHFWYARGIAFAATGRPLEARATIDSITGVAQGMPAGEPRLTLQIAAHMVTGEVALRAGDAEGAVRAFAAAAALEDQLAYMEPPTWYHPVRHSLGKALLAAGRASEAERAYRADLRRFPENGWALRGLALSLEAQGRSAEARRVNERFAKAWRLADVTITASRF
jgi:tetratricopeptide (TPR) repeat protein